MSVAKEEQSWRAKLYMKDEEISQLKTKYSQIHSKQILELQEQLAEKEKRNQEFILQCEQLRARAFGAYVKLEDVSNYLNFDFQLLFFYSNLLNELHLIKI